MSRPPDSTSAGITPKHRILNTGTALALVVGLAAACNSAPRTPEEALLRTRCGRCHRYDHALNKRKSARGWERTVWAMRQRGAELSDREAESLVRYLAGKRGLR